MKRWGLLIAVGILALVNAVVLGGVAYNRSGEPDAVMVLSERELPASWGHQNQENTGISLRINTYHEFYWGRRAGAYDPFAWLDRKKLESLGFDFPQPVTADNKYDLFERHLPRRTFAVLEFGGAACGAWEKLLAEELAALEQEVREGKKTAQQHEAARTSLERELRTGSRLFIIDAGNDPALLRATYADRSRYLILPATVRISYYGSYAAPETGTANLRGAIGLLIDEINVPRQFHSRVNSRLPRAADILRLPQVPVDGPRYEVSIRTGRRYEPWIEEIVSKQP